MDYSTRRRIVGPKMFCFMKKNVNELAALKRRLADLEQHNQKLQLENEALVTMIDLAEQQFKIPIRKKSGPKQ
jgi:hypothetical protein